MEEGCTAVQNPDGKSCRAAYDQVLLVAVLDSLCGRFRGGGSPATPGRTLSLNDLKLASQA